MTPLTPIVRHIAPNGQTTPMNYLVWPQYNPANDYHRNQYAKRQLANIAHQPQLSFRPAENEYNRELILRLRNIGPNGQLPPSNLRY